jgi:polyhydroxybutyrate depolymerase
MVATLIKKSVRASTVVAAVTLWAHAAFADGWEALTWKVDGVARRAIIYAPSRSNGKSPLVLSFHGHGDNAVNFQHTNLHLVWPEAIVVYFQGLPGGRELLPGWQTEKGQNGDRDLRLVDVAIASLGQQFNVDGRRIYATGFSNGAMFTYLLWAERPSIFAAFAAVAGRIRSSTPKQPRPIFHIGGLQDASVPFAAQKEAIETAKRVNGVDGDGIACGTGCTLYDSPNGAPVMTWIHPSGHIYPPGVSERIVQFFRTHPLVR